MLRQREYIALYPSASIPRWSLILCLGMAFILGSFAVAHAQGFGIAEYNSAGHLIFGTNIYIHPGDCPDVRQKNPLPTGKECWGTVEFDTPEMPKSNFRIVATYQAINNPQQANGAVVVVTASVKNLTGFNGSLSLLPNLYFQMSGGPQSPPISATGSLRGDCFGATQFIGSYMDSALAIGFPYVTPQVDALCPIILVRPNSGVPSSYYIAGVEFNIPPASYVPWAPSLFYSPQILWYFAPGSHEDSFQTSESITKLGPSSFLIP